MRVVAQSVPRPSTEEKHGRASAALVSKASRVAHPSSMHTVRGLIACVVVILVLAIAPRGRADLVDDGWRVMPLALTLSNAADHQASWGFVISPAPERGMAYVLEPGLTMFMRIRSDITRGPSRLCAVPRADFDTLVAAGSRVAPTSPMTVREPTRSIVANASIVDALEVREDSPRVSLERTYRITTLTAERFEVVLEREEAILRDGRRERTRPTPRR